MAGERRLGTLLLIMILTSLDAFAAGKDPGAGALGWITGKESVWINSQPALPGTAVFRGDIIQTGKSARAVMNLPSGTSAALSEDSEVALGLETSQTSLNLRRGTVVVRSAGQQPARVTVLGASVMVQGEGGFPAICTIAALGRAAEVFNDGGRVEIHGISGGPTILPKGKHARLEAGRPQGGGQLAGKVSSAIPAETVQRVGQTTEVALNVQDPINWEDWVRTQRAGRVRIELLDGSFLNVGARSAMKITRHDPQSQQTVVELTVGRLRGEIIKFTKPGASFHVNTQTAVIGVVGAIFLIVATPEYTRVYCIEGVITVQNAIASIAGVTTLRAGEFATIPRGLPPTGAFQFTPGQLQAQLNQTSLGGPVGGGVNVASTVLNTSRLVVGTTTAVLSGVAVTVVDTARSSSDAASGSAKDATDSSLAATAAATEAETIAQEILSASQPCGCE